MNLYNLMMKRRSVRIFEDQEIPESIIEQLLDVANQAPSGGNIQPLSIILVGSLEGRKKLAELEVGRDVPDRFSRGEGSESLSDRLCGSDGGCPECGDPC